MVNELLLSIGFSGAVKGIIALLISTVVFLLKKQFKDSEREFRDFKKASTDKFKSLDVSVVSLSKENSHSISSKEELYTKKLERLVEQSNINQNKISNLMVDLSEKETHFFKTIHEQSITINSTLSKKIDLVKQSNEADIESIEKTVDRDIQEAKVFIQHLSSKASKSKEKIHELNTKIATVVVEFNNIKKVGLADAIEYVRTQFDEILMNDIANESRKTLASDLVNKCDVLIKNERDVTNKKLKYFQGMLIKINNEHKELVSSLNLNIKKLENKIKKSHEVDTLSASMSAELIKLKKRLDAIDKENLGRVRIK